MTRTPPRTSPTTETRTEGLIELARIGRPWGVRGEQLLHLLNPAGDAFDHLDTILLGEPGALVRRAIADLRIRGRKVTVRLEGVTDPDGCRPLVGERVFAFREDLPETDDDEVMLADLVDLEVLGPGDRLLGRVTGFYTNTAQDILVVHDGTTETLIPLVDELVDEIDLETGHIRVSLETA